MTNELENPEDYTLKEVLCEVLKLSDEEQEEWTQEHSEWLNEEINQLVEALQHLV